MGSWSMHRAEHHGHNAPQALADVERTDGAEAHALGKLKEIDHGNHGAVLLPSEGTMKRAAFQGGQPMTCARSDVYWRDAAYNAVSKMPGSVNAAAAFLTKRRGVSIKGETLRKKLRGLDGESISMEMLEMLTEWMLEQAAGTSVATDWILSLAAQFNLAIDHVPPAPEGGWPDEVAAIKEKLLHVSKFCGQLSAVALDVLDDNKVTLVEADRMLAALKALRTMCHRMERNLRRALSKSRQRG